MPRFFVDTSDGDNLTPDDEGEEFDDLEAARKFTIAALPEIVEETLSDGEHREFRAVLRDESKHTIYAVTLIFHGEWRT